MVESWKVLAELEAEDESESTGAVSRAGFAGDAGVSSASCVKTPLQADES